EEPRLGFIPELCRAHYRADYIPGAKAGPGEADLSQAWTIQCARESGPVLKQAVEDFASYCKEIMHTRKIEVRRPPEPASFSNGKRSKATTPRAASKRLDLVRDGSLGKDEAYSLRIYSNSIVIGAGA